LLRLIRSLQSVEDQIAIWQHVAIHNGIAADRLIDRFDDRINSLLQSPEIGERQPQFGEHTRRLIVGNYLIFYDVLPDAIRILRVFHAARKIEDLFG
jgi:toxin ParE1/3/4